MNKKQTNTSLITDTSFVYFIVLGWNNKDLLEECFGSIFDQSYRDIKVIYVDNGSSDGSIEYVKENYPQIDLLDLGTNTGFAKGNNLGIQKALEDKKCGYVALLNTDARVSSNWIEVLLTFAKSKSNIASLQSPTLDYYDRDILDSRGLKVDFYGRAVQLGYREKFDNSMANHRIYGVNAAAAIYTRQFLENQPFKSEFLDEQMWMFIEDVDIATRALMIGMESWLVTGTSAYHMGSASTSKNPGFSVFYSYRNNAYLLYKNFSSLLLLRMIPLAIFSDIESIYRNLRGKNKVAVKAMVSGRVVSLINLYKFNSKRKIMSKSRIINKSELYSLMRSR